MLSLWEQLTVDVQALVDEAGMRGEVELVLCCADRSGAAALRNHYTKEMQRISVLTYAPSDPAITPEMRINGLKLRIEHA